MELFCKKCGQNCNVFIEVKSNNHCAYCSQCGGFIQNVPYDEPRMYFGRYKDMKIEDIDDKPYLQWVLDNTDVSGRIREAIEVHIKTIQKNG